MSRVLVVDRADDLAAALHGEPGLHVEVARSASEGERRAREEPADLVLLRRELGPVDGLQVCRALAQGGASIPVVLASDRGAEEDRVAGLEAGADDYVVLPMAARELVLRVRAVLRRRARERPPAIQLGELRIDRAAHQAWLRGHRVHFTPVELRVLLVLHAAQGGVVRRADLLREVWGRGGRDASRSIDQYVKRLRAKVGDAVCIETVRGVGYRLATR